MKNEENCLRKILKIRVSHFSIDRKSLSIDRTSQKVEFEFLIFSIDRGAHWIDQKKQNQNFFLSVFTCKKNKTMCN